MTWENFHREEFNCQHCGKNEMADDFISALQVVRTVVGAPLVISSGYRCRNHPREQGKAEPGTHSLGIAADVSARGEFAYRVVQAAMASGLFTGIWIYTSHVHLDMATPEQKARPFIGPGK